MPRKTCYKCYGSGRMPCKVLSGRRKCTACNGVGKVECSAEEAERDKRLRGEKQSDYDDRPKFGHRDDDIDILGI